MAKSYLIIGKESCLGASLLGYFSRRGGDIFATSRNNPLGIYLDLQNPIEFIQKRCPRVDVAFIGAAITSQKICHNDPEGAWNINVVKTSELISGLLDRGIFVIFPSTNLVLSCSSPNMSSSSSRQPQGFYATCKAEIESRFEGTPNFASIRIPKVIQPNLPIILQWFKSLEMGKSLAAFSNVIINPISLGYATEAIARFMHQPLPGIWHLSGQSEISY
jgi:dTDP-4-dehydrorhamnose reductase